jgi:hypothetical protein
MAAFNPRSWSRVLLGAGAALLVGFGLSWLYAAQRLGDFLHERVFDGAAFADFCATSEVGGFPFRLKLTCAGFAAPAQIGGLTLMAKADEAKGSASLWSPNHIVVTFSSPLSLQRADSAFAKVRHDGLALDFAWGSGGLSQAALSAQALDWRPEVLEAGPAFNIQALNFAARPSDRDGVPSAHVEFSTEGLTAPLLQSLLKDPGANALDVAGDMVPPPPLRGDWPAALESWRLRKGVAHIDKGEWRWAQVTARFNGSLALDENHRLTGTINVKASGADQLLARLGLPIANAAAKNLIGALFGQKPQDKRPDGAQDDSVSLTFRLSEGRVLLGPIKVATLAPLY